VKRDRTYLLKEQALAELVEVHAPALDDAEVDGLDAARRRLTRAERCARQVVLVYGERDDVAERQYQALRDRVERRQRVEVHVVA
jgi:hypothetical protein